MTVICGYRGESSVWLGADSASANGGSRAAVHTPKLIGIQVPYWEGERTIGVGYTTSWRFGQLLTYHLHPPIDHTSDALEYLVKELVPQARDALKDGGWLKIKNERQQGGSALIAYRGRLFEMQSDFSVLENIEPWAATGSGEDYALGAMSVTQSEAEGIVEDGLKAAATFAPGVMPPFHIQEFT